MATFTSNIPMIVNNISTMKDVSAQNIELSGNLFVSGSSTLSESLDVSGDVVVRSRLDVSGDVVVDGTLDVSGDVVVDGGLDVSGDVFFGSDFDVSGDVSMGGTLSCNSVNVNDKYYYDDKALGLYGDTLHYYQVEDDLNTFINSGVVEGDTILFPSGSLLGNVLMEDVVNVRFIGIPEATKLSGTFDITTSLIDGNRLCRFFNIIFEGLVTIAGPKRGHTFKNCYFKGGLTLTGSTSGNFDMAFTECRINILNVNADYNSFAGSSDFIRCDFNNATINALQSIKSHIELQDCFNIQDDLEANTQNYKVVGSSIYDTFDTAINTANAFYVNDDNDIENLNPSVNRELTTKYYVDNELSGKQDDIDATTDLTCKSINSTGNVSIGGTPTETTHATNKSYVDNKIVNIFNSETSSIPRTIISDLSPTIWAVAGEAVERVNSASISITTGLATLETFYGKQVWSIIDNETIGQDPPVIINAIIPQSSNTYTISIAFGSFPFIATSLFLQQPINRTSLNVSKRIFYSGSSVIGIDEFEPDPPSPVIFAPIHGINTHNNAITIRRNGNDINLYYNGNFVASQTHTEVYSGANVDRIGLGGRPVITSAVENTTRGGSRIGGCAVWDRVLTDSEVKLLTYDNITAF